MKLNNEYSRHQVWQSIKDLSEAVDKHKLGRGPIDLGIKARTRAALNYMEAFRTKYLLAPSNWQAVLDSVDVELQFIKNYYSNWIEGGISASALNAIENSINNCLHSFRDWPVLIQSQSAKKFDEARLLLEEIAIYREEQVELFQKSEEALRLLQADLQKAKSSWELESDSLSQVKAEIKKLTSDIALDARRDLADEATILKKNYIESLDSVLLEANEYKSHIGLLVEEAENLASIKAGHVLSEGYELHARRLDAERGRWIKAGFSQGGNRIDSAHAFPLSCREFGTQHSALFETLNNGFFRCIGHLFV